MSLDVVNYVNKNITDVVNKNIGQKVFIPQKVKFTEPLEGAEGALAFVDMTLQSKEFGELFIIKDQFMMNSVSGADKMLLNLLTDKTRKGINFVPKSGELRNLYERYQKGDSRAARGEDRGDGGGGFRAGAAGDGHPPLRRHDGRGTP